MTIGATRTFDSRYLHRNSRGGEFFLYNMYSRNIRAEGDGIGYNELNLLRAILLEPVLYVVMRSNLLLHFNFGLMNGYVILGHGLGLIFNLFRLVISVSILIFEAIAWPVRIIVGIALAPIAMLLSAGHVYALPCKVIHELLFDTGFIHVRRITVSQFPVSRKRVLNAGVLGPVQVYEASSGKQASYIASYLQIQQRCGNGPESIWIHGRHVLVSDWRQISLSGILQRGKFSWDLLDLRTWHWRRTIFQFGDKGILTRSSPHRAHLENGSCVDSPESSATECDVGNSMADAGVNSITDFRDETRFMTTRSEGLNQQQILTGIQTASLRKNVLSDETLDPLSTLSEVEEFYTSPLGWNKYHWMQATGNQVRVLRRDRRVLAHITALVSCLFLYFQFREESTGWFGISVELQALLVANYALVVVYAAEIVVGKTVDIVDAKSERYGTIVTRAIDSGFVRGFHVPNGHWLGYKNGAEWLPWHSVTPEEVNATCNSVVFKTGYGRKIKVLTPYGSAVDSWEATFG
ncbi:hypothetical protein FGB62_69g117 [Gracilaria domingensis]|nr:hypothetical protein FGB62_69g117 [Gracilaria domingensis]